MRIDRWIAMLAMVFVGSPAAAESLYGFRSDGPERGAIDIEIVRTIELHPAFDNIRKVCRAEWDVRGCTDFPVETLQCNCELRGDAWVINASAKLQAVTHLRNASQHASSLAHEALHMTDLAEGLRKHLEMLAARRYQSATTCRRFAHFLSTSQHLRVVMNQLRVASNAKLGCSRGHH